ncbi:MAG TPA: SGNH/GDSL hydrolase family protein, partial [Planctomycetota bacterium]|nr:SGNH/GDSL hydrolase family protein [Planctomycetota bacterium]
AFGDKILFSPDGVHPYADCGHGVYHDVFQRGMARIGDEGVAKPHALPAPLAADNWENATMAPLSKTTMTKGWEAVPPNVHAWVRERMPEFWRATKAGEGISFKFKGTAVSVYDLLGPDCGQIVVTLDDRAPVTVSKFDRFSTYHRLGTTFVGTQLPDGVHRVKIEVSPEKPDKEKILQKGSQKMDDPKHFEGSTWYAGGILLVGELLKD